MLASTSRLSSPNNNCMNRKSGVEIALFSQHPLVNSGTSFVALETRSTRLLLTLNRGAKRVAFLALGEKGIARVCRGNPVGDLSVEVVGITEQSSAAG